MVLYKKDPALNEYQVLERLRNSSLRDTANYLHALLQRTVDIISRLQRGIRLTTLKRIVMPLTHPEP